MASRADDEVEKAAAADSANPFGRGGGSKGGGGVSGGSGGGGDDEELRQLMREIEAIERKL